MKLKPLSLTVLAFLAVVSAAAAVKHLNGRHDSEVDEKMSFAAGTDVREWAVVRSADVRLDWLQESLHPAGERAFWIKQTCGDDARTEVLTVRAPGKALLVPSTVAFMKLSPRETFSVRRALTNSARPKPVSSNANLPKFLDLQCKTSELVAAVPGLKDATVQLSQSTALRPFAVEWAGHSLEFEPISNPKFSRGWKASVTFANAETLLQGFESITRHLTMYQVHPTQKSEWLTSLDPGLPPLARYWTYFLEDDMMIRIAMARHSFGPQTVGEGMVEILLTKR